MFLKFKSWFYSVFRFCSTCAKVFGDNTTHRHAGASSFRPVHICTVHNRITSDIEGHCLCEQDLIIKRDEVNLNMKAHLAEWQMQNYGKFN